MLTTSLAVKRTVPARSSAALPATSAARAQAWAAASMRCAGSASASAAGVGCSRRAPRSNKGVPSCASSAAICRLSVGWLVPSRTAAWVSDPCASTAPRARSRFQSSVAGSKAPAMHSILNNCHACIHLHMDRKPAQHGGLSIHQEHSMNQTVLVLGANGRLGRAAVLAFSAAGWQVRAQLRRPPRAPLPAGVQLLQCDAQDLPALTAAGQGAPVIVNALSPDYTQWARLLPPITATTLALARATGATLMLPGNVYNFGNQLPPVLTETTPFAATHPKAAQRMALEAALADAAAAGVRSIVIRAGDFLGDAGTWLDLAMAKGLARGRFTQMGPANLPHAWAWLPDLAQTFVQVAARRAALPAHAVLHFPGLTLTGAQLQQACAAALGRPLQTRQFPWPLLRLATPFSPMLRSLFEMRYLWQRPHSLDGSRLQALLGTVPQTPVDSVVRQCIDSLGLPTR